MDSLPEREMTIGPSCDPKLKGSLERLPVPIPRWEEQQDLFSASDLLMRDPRVYQRGRAE